MKLNDNEREWLVNVALGEARGEGVVGMWAVMCCILNRVRKPRWWGGTILKVIQKRGQFSCLWRPDGTLVPRDYYTRMALTHEEHRARALVELIGSGALVDITYGCTHFINPKAVKTMPAWTKTLPRVWSYRQHDFYRED